MNRYTLGLFGAALVISGCGSGGGRGSGDGGSSDGPAGCMGAACNPDPCASVTCSGHGTCSTSSGDAACTCDAGYHASELACISDGGVFGMTLPTDHPRLLFDDGNLAAAKAWYSAHPQNPRSDDYLGLALEGLLANDASACASAYAWALDDSNNTIQHSGNTCDNCRWDGESIILIYDWCYASLSDSQRSTLATSIDSWIDLWRTATWGGVPMHENNYYWGYLRNELEWGITRYDTNQTLANTELDDVFNVRLQNDFYPAAKSGGAIGGVGQEGAQYGPYVLAYASIPLVTAGRLGRDMFSESSYYLAGIYAYIYETTPDGQQLFTWNDNDNETPAAAADTFIADYMLPAALHWSAVPAGGHARQWLASTASQPDPQYQAVDTGMPAATAFSNLPLDYFAAGPRYLFGRSSWTATTPTAFLLQLGDEDGIGHSHQDVGTFQIFRGGKWLSRESVGYQSSGISVVGLGGSGSVDVSTPVAHNSVAVGTALPDHDGSPKVDRLESQPGYSFASVDLSPAFASGTVQRDFVFVRGLETMVVHDRGGNVFLAHCETMPAISGAHATCTNGSQALVVTSLVGSPTFRVVTEGGMSGQYRLEISASGSEMITVLQAKDASATPLSPALVDNGASYTLTLDGATSLQLVKGATSTGGSITIGGATTSFRADVEPTDMMSSGPVWQ